ncbi:MAG: methionyl-tRNA formyltransferase [bacterium]|nr:methionyl-tRNA formyltransferase [bacterium]
MIRVVFMGSADLSATMLQRLVRETDTIQVVGCVTQPDKPAGRSKKLTPCACKAFVDQAGIPCLTPERVNAPESLARIAAWLPDVIVVVAYGQFLSKRLLDIPTMGCINIHLSLLPRYRGASPIHAALLAGDKVTGASAMLMDEGMDSGPVLMTSETAITPEDTLESLHDRLADMGADLLAKVLPLWAYFKVKPVRQDPALVTTAYKIKKSDGLLHWSDATEFSLRKIRAYTPWPSCYTFMPENHKSAGKMLKILAAEAYPVSVAETKLAPGTVLQASKTAVVVRTVDGALRLIKVQPEGGKPMDVAAWMCGNAVEKGMCFVTPPAPEHKPIEAYRRT